MILKVERDLGSFQLWDNLENVTIYKAECSKLERADNITRFSFAKVDRRATSKEILAISCPSPQVIIIETEGVDPKGDNLKEGAKPALIDSGIVYKGWYIEGCERSSNKEFSIFFDTTAYLLNDEGKTIEVLR